MYTLSSIRTLQGRYGLPLTDEEIDRSTHASRSTGNKHQGWDVNLGMSVSRAWALQQNPVLSLAKDRIKREDQRVTGQVHWTDVPARVHLAPLPLVLDFVFFLWIHQTEWWLRSFLWF